MMTQIMTKMTKVSLSQAVYSTWYHHYDHSENEYAITEQDLFLVPDNLSDINDRVTGNMQKKIETVIIKLHTPPCSNTK